MVDNMVMYKERIIVQEPLRGVVLETLHAAHQGVYGITLRAERLVWCPGITNLIKQVRRQCKTCDEVAPSQPRGTPVRPEEPVYPFQMICADHFCLEGRNCLVIVDRFSG